MGSKRYELKRQTLKIGRQIIDRKERLFVTVKYAQLISHFRIFSPKQNFVMTSCFGFAVLSRCFCLVMCLLQSFFDGG